MAQSFSLLGQLTCQFQGDGEVFTAVRRELSPSFTPFTLAPDLCFSFEDSLPDLPFDWRDRVGICGKRIRVASNPEIVYDVDQSESLWRIIAHCTPHARRARYLPLSAQRFIDWNYLFAHERVAKDFIYDVFDWVTQLAQLKKGQSYIHASSLTKAGRGLAFVARGGAGKTTLLLRLCLRDGWSYLSDDLGLVDNGGKLHYTPKKLQVYAYNVRGDPVLHRRLLAGRSVGDLCSWWLRRGRSGPKGVRRRVAPSALFGESSVAASAGLTDAVYLDRCLTEGCSASPMSVEVLARVAAEIVFDEINPYSCIQQQLAAAGHTLLPSAKDVIKSTTEVLAQAFSGANILHIRIGRDIGPADLQAYVSDVLQLE